MLNFESLIQQITDTTISIPIIGDICAGVSEKLSSGLKKMFDDSDVTNLSTIIIYNDRKICYADLIQAVRDTIGYSSDSETEEFINAEFLNSIDNEFYSVNEVLNDVKNQITEADTISDILTHFDLSNPANYIKDIISGKAEIFNNSDVLSQFKGINETNWPQKFGSVLNSLTNYESDGDYSVKHKVGNNIACMILQSKVAEYVSAGLNMATTALAAAGYGIVAVIGYVAKCVMEIGPNLIRLFNGYGPICRVTTNPYGITPFPLFDGDVDIGKTATNEDQPYLFNVPYSYLVNKFGEGRNLITKIGSAYIVLRFLSRTVVPNTDNFTDRYHLTIYGSAHGNVSMLGLKERDTTSLPPLWSYAESATSAEAAGLKYNAEFSTVAGIPVQLSLLLDKWVRNTYSGYMHFYDVSGKDNISCANISYYIYPNSVTTGSMLDLNLQASLSEPTPKAFVIPVPCYNTLGLVVNASNAYRVVDVPDEFNLSNNDILNYPINISNDIYQAGTELLYSALGSINHARRTIQYWFYKNISDFNFQNSNNSWFIDDTHFCTPAFNESFKFKKYFLGISLPLESFEWTNVVVKDQWSPLYRLKSELLTLNTREAAYRDNFYTANDGVGFPAGLASSRIIPTPNYLDQDIAKHWAKAFGYDQTDGSVVNGYLQSPLLNGSFDLTDLNAQFCPIGNYHANFINFIVDSLFAKDCLIHQDLINDREIEIPDVMNEDMAYFDLPELTQLPTSCVEYVNDFERQFIVGGQLAVGLAAAAMVTGFIAKTGLKMWAYNKRLENENKRWTVMGSYDPSHPDGYDDEEGHHPSYKEYMSTMKKANLQDNILNVLGGKTAYGEVIDSGESSDSTDSISDTVAMIYNSITGTDIK